MNTEAKIESILFYKNEPVKVKKLSELLELGEAEVLSAIERLSESLKGRGLAVILNEGEASISTSAEVSPLIERIAKEELSRDIGRAGLETMAIILYNGPISRRKIDYIRGVNSTFILRSLLMRGLVEKVENKEDLRMPLYKPTIALLSHLGIKKLADLPEYRELKSQLESLNKESENAE